MAIVKSKAYYTLLELRAKYEREVRTKSKRIRSISHLSYENSMSSEIILGHNERFTFVAWDVFIGLDDRARLMICQIIEELKLNNPFWQFDQRENPRDSAVITVLREKGVLFKTGTTIIHLVNPFMIRRGDLGNIIHQALNLMEKTPRVNEDHIKQLPWGGKFNIKGFDYLKTD